MSNSSLAKYIDISTGHLNSRLYPITRITIHHAACVCTLEDFSSIIRSKECSWNYGIANDGQIGLYVDESMRAWTSNSPDNDHRSINIMVSNSGTGGDWPISDAAYKSLLDLCEDICRRNKISPLTYTGELSGSNLTIHSFFVPTECPGKYLESRLPTIVSEVNKRLTNNHNKNTSATNEVNQSSSKNSTIISSSDSNTSNNSLQQFSESNITAYDAAVVGTNENYSLTLDYSNITPYIITVDRKSPNVDYTAMKNLGVIGVMIEAGYLYDTAHMETTFRNPELKSQAAAANKAGLNFALYGTMRAHNIEEAKKEMYHLSFAIRTFAPKLGVWLTLNLVKSKTINNQILETYYKELVRLGLKDRIGLYVNRTQLNQIDWSSYCNDWYLWIDDHIDSFSNLGEILTPQFFVVGGNS